MGVFKVYKGIKKVYVGLYGQSVYKEDVAVYKVYIGVHKLYIYIYTKNNEKRKSSLLLRYAFHRCCGYSGIAKCFY